MGKSRAKTAAEEILNAPAAIPDPGMVTNTGVGTANTGVATTPSTTSDVQTAGGGTGGSTDPGARTPTPPEGTTPDVPALPWTDISYEPVGPNTMNLHDASGGDFGVSYTPFVFYTDTGEKIQVTNYFKEKSKRRGGQTESVYSQHELRLYAAPEWLAQADPGMFGQWTQWVNSHRAAYEALANDPNRGSESWLDRYYDLLEEQKQFEDTFLPMVTTLIRPGNETNQGPAPEMPTATPPVNQPQTSSDPNRARDAIAALQAEYDRAVASGDQNQIDTAQQALAKGQADAAVAAAGAGGGGTGPVVQTAPVTEPPPADGETPPISAAPEFSKLWDDIQKKLPKDRINDITDQFLTNLMQSVGTLSWEEEATIRRQGSEAIQAALSGASGRGMGRSSEATGMMVQGEFKTQEMLGAAKKSAREQGLAFGLQAAALQTERQTAKNNLAVAMSGQNIELIKNQAGQSLQEYLAKHQVEMDLRGATLDEAKFEQFKLDAEREFGLKLDDQELKKFIETGELTLSAINIDETNRLQQLKIANDFLLTQRDQDIQEKLGISKLELEKWIAGEQIDVQKMATATQKALAMLGYNIQIEQIRAALAAAEATDDPSIFADIAGLGAMLAFLL